MLNILIVEDLQATSIWMESVAKKAFGECHVLLSPSLLEAKKVIDQQRLAFALIDLNLSDGSGLELIPIIREKNPDAYIVVMTIFDNDEHVFSAIKAGAMGYLLKDQSEELLIHKLQGIMRGDPPLSPLIARKILEHVRHPDFNHSNSMETISFDLTNREKEILTMIAKGLNRTEIAEMLSLSSHTIARYIRDIYMKLDVSSRAEAAVIAHQMGLLDKKNDF